MKNRITPMMARMSFGIYHDTAAHAASMMSCIRLSPDAQRAEPREPGAKTR